MKILSSSRFTKVNQDIANLSGVIIRTVKASNFGPLFQKGLLSLIETRPTEK
jgi:hypothetical protein